MNIRFVLLVAAISPVGALACPGREPLVLECKIGPHQSARGYSNTFRVLIDEEKGTLTLDPSRTPALFVLQGNSELSLTATGRPQAQLPPTQLSIDRFSATAIISDPEPQGEQFIEAFASCSRLNKLF